MIKYHRCRYIKRSSNAQCTAQPVDPEGQVILCSKHLAWAIQMFEEAKAKHEMGDTQ